MSEYSFTRDSIETKCLELRSVCKKIEIIFTQRRQSLLKFLDLFEGIEAISKVINKWWGDEIPTRTDTVQWCQAAEQQLSSSEQQEETNEDIINNLTQLEYLTEKENVKSGYFLFTYLKLKLKEIPTIQNVAGGFTNMDYRLKIWNWNQSWILRTSLKWSKIWYHQKHYSWSTIKSICFSKWGEASSRGKKIYRIKFPR